MRIVSRKDTTLDYVCKDNIKRQLCFTALRWISSGHIRWEGLLSESRLGRNRVNRGHIIEMMGVSKKARISNSVCDGPMRGET